MSERKQYTDKELTFFDGLIDDMILELFDNNIGKRFAIETQLKKAYDAGRFGIRK